MKRRYQVDATSLVANLESKEDLDFLVARMSNEDVSMLVNNAGAGGLGATASASAKQLNRIIRLNITALTRLSHAALAQFRDRGAGTLVNIGSMMAFCPAEGGAVYSGSKAYVQNFTESLQLEYSESPIRIQLVIPGPVHTEFFSSQDMDESVFPESTYLKAEQLVDAALAGLALGDGVTIPSVLKLASWTTLVKARSSFLDATLSGKVAERYV